MNIRTSFQMLNFSADFSELPKSVLVDIFKYITESAGVTITQPEFRKIDAWLKSRESKHES